MPTLRGPLFSIRASQRLGSQLSFQTTRGTNRVTTLPIPSQPVTLPKTYHRQDYSDYVLWWNLLSVADKAAYEALAVGQSFTPYNAWIKNRLLNLPDLVGRWHLDTFVAGAYADSSKNTNPATPFGPVLVPGIWGNALWFDGLDDYAALGSPSEFSALPNMAIEGWFRTTAGPTRNIIAKVAPGAREWAVYQRGTPTQLRIRFFNTALGNYAQATTPGSFNDGLWHYFMGILRDTVDIVIWVDGQPYDRNSSFTGTRAGDTGSAAAIGRFGAELSQYWSGSLDELRIYSRAPADLEINQHYARGALQL